MSTSSASSAEAVPSEAPIKPADGSTGQEFCRNRCCNEKCIMLYQVLLQFCTNLYIINGCCLFWGDDFVSISDELLFWGMFVDGS